MSIETTTAAAEQRWQLLRLELAHARRRGGTTQDEIAAATGSARSTVGRVERGDAEPGIVQLIAHARAVDLDVVLVQPHMARLLALDVADISALVSAAVCANRRQQLSPAQQARLITVLVKLSPHRQQDGAA